MKHLLLPPSLQHLIVLLGNADLVHVRPGVRRPFPLPVLQPRASVSLIVSWESALGGHTVLLSTLLIHDEVRVGFILVEAEL